MRAIIFALLMFYAFCFVMAAVKSDEAKAPTTPQKATP